MSNDATNIRVVLAEKAWQEGYAAGRRGLSAVANPYAAGTPERRAWLSGLCAGRAKPRRLVSVDEALVGVSECTPRAASGPPLQEV